VNFKISSIRKPKILYQRLTMRKKRKPLIYRDEKGNFILKEEDFSNSPKESLKPSNPPMTEEEYEAEMKKFLESVKKEIKKGLKKKSRRAKPRNKK